MNTEIEEIVWTKDTPARDGLYWARPGEQPEGSAVLVLVMHGLVSGKRYLAVWGSSGEVERQGHDYNYWWYGPILVPPPIPEGLADAASQG